MDVTVITSIFDLSEIEESKRPSADTYLQRGLSVLKSDVNLIVFGDPDSLKKVQEIREPYESKTSLISIEISKLYQSIDQVKELLKKQNPDNPTKNTPYYYALIWAKISFLQGMVTNNPFGNSYVVWIDLGLTHISEWTKYINLEDICQSVQSHPGLVHLTIMDLFPIKQFKESPKEFWTQHAGLCSGALIGGDRESLNWLSKEFWAMNRHLLDQKGLVTWEEKILGYLTWKFPEKFHLWFGGYYSIGINWGKIRWYSAHLKSFLQRARESPYPEHKIVGYSLGIQMIETGGISNKELVEIYDDTFICAWYADTEKRMERCLDIGQKLLKLAETNPEFHQQCQLRQEHLNNNLRFVNLKINPIGIDII